MKCKKKIIWGSDLQEDELDFQNLKSMFDIQLSNPILVIGDLGRWNGRVSGYKIINSGNIADILYSNCDHIELYADAYNIKSIAEHHDGTNYYLYREIKDNVNIDILLNKIYNNQLISPSMLSYYTKSILPAMNDVICINKEEII